MYPQKSALIRNGSVSPVRADMMRIIRFVPDYFRIISGLFADFRLVQGRGVRQQPGPGIGKGVKTRFRGFWRFWPCQGTGRAICVAWRPVSGVFRGYSERRHGSEEVGRA